MQGAATQQGHGVKFKEFPSSDKGLTLLDEDVEYAQRVEVDVSDGKQGPPKNIFEAGERGLVGWIVKSVERTLEFDINQRDRLSRTALHWAAEMGHVEAVEALMDYGCDAKLLECNGRTAVHLAARGGHVEVLKALVASKAPKEVELMVNQPDNIGITPVFLALQRGEDGRLCFEFLMDCGARYNTTTPGSSSSSLLKMKGADSDKPSAE